MPDKTKKKVLLLGMALMERPDIDTLKAAIKEDFPDHEVRIIPGLLWASEFEVSRTIETERPPGAYL